MISLVFLQGEKTKRYRTNVREMFSSSTFIKIKGTKELAYFVLFFVMLTSSSSAAPNSARTPTDSNREYTFRETADQQIVSFHNRPCKQVDTEHLQYQMGKFYDSSKMALDKKSISSNSVGERSIGDMYHNKIDDDNSYYQGDNPYLDSDFEEDEDDVSDSPKDTLKDDKGSTPNQNSINYMRRKRQASDNNDDNDIDQLKSTDDKPQKRLFSDLKKFIRKSKKGKIVKKLPWTCKMKSIWTRLESGYFPPWILTGSCQSTKKCFYNLYDCIPKTYVITILRRDPNRCNPVPLVGNTTTYEEVWFFKKLDETVACECGIGQNRNPRRRNRGRP